MLKNRFPFCMLAVATSLFLKSAFAQPVLGANHKRAEQNVRAVVLMQKSFVYGNLKTTLAADAVRVEALGRNLVLVAKAPSWKVGFYNTKTKKALEMSFSDYVRHEIQYSYLKGQTPSPQESRQSLEAMLRSWDSFYAPRGKINYIGTTCDSFWHVHSPHDPRPELHYFGIYYTIPLAFVEKKGQVVVDKFLGCENDFGVAVFYYKRELNKDRSQYGTAAGFGDLLSGNPGLRSTSFEHKSVPSSQFNYLEGFSPVHKEVEVVGYDDGQDVLPSLDGFK